MQEASRDYSGSDATTSEEGSPEVASAHVVVPDQSIFCGAAGCAARGPCNGLKKIWVW